MSKSVGQLRPRGLCRSHIETWLDLAYEILLLWIIGCVIKLETMGALAARILLGCVYIRG